MDEQHRNDVVHVEFEKMASDGDYGRERSAMSITHTLVTGESRQVVETELQAECRARVEADLAESVNLHVRRAMLRAVRRCGFCNEPLDDAEQGYQHPVCREQERAERDARYREEKAKQDAQWAAEDAAAAAEAEHRDEAADEAELATVADAEDSPF